MSEVDLGIHSGAEASGRKSILRTLPLWGAEGVRCYQGVGEQRRLWRRDSLVLTSSNETVEVPPASVDVFLPNSNACRCSVQRFYLHKHSRRARVSLKIELERKSRD